MYSMEWLGTLRCAEADFVAARMPLGARVLEVGGGTGHQARALAEHGFSVTSIDVAESNYRDHMVYDVTPYDGRSFPFPNGTFDVVFSSNVLEHLKDPRTVHSEIGRVLRPGGFALHLVPSASWRVSTYMTGYLELMRSLREVAYDFAQSHASWPKKVRVSLVRTGRIAIEGAAPAPHGESSNALVEAYRFSKTGWLRHFHQFGYVVDCVEEGGIFYTGHSTFGAAVSLQARRRLARIVGSACTAFHVRPGGT